MVLKAEYPLRLAGSISFVGEIDDRYQGIVVDAALLRSKTEIVIEFCSDGHPYCAKLKSKKDGIRFKTVSVEGKGEVYDIQADCTRYSNDEGHLLLGRWVEEGDEYTWWAELHPIETG